MLLLEDEWKTLGPRIDGQLTEITVGKQVRMILKVISASEMETVDRLKIRVDPPLHLDEDNKPVTTPGAQSVPPDPGMILEGLCLVKAPGVINFCAEAPICPLPPETDMIAFHEVTKCAVAFADFYGPLIN